MSELTERLVATRDRMKALTKQGEDNVWRPAKDAVEVMADAANRIVKLEAELEYAYRTVNFGFEYGSFDFSVLRKRAAEAFPAT